MNKGVVRGEMRCGQEKEAVFWSCREAYRQASYRYRYRYRGGQPGKAQFRLG